MAFALAAVSCGQGEAAFGSARRRLDSILASAPPRDPKALADAFAKAQKAAGSGRDWLSLLSRARRAEYSGDGGRYAAVSRAALSSLKAEGGSREVAAAAVSGLLRSGFPQEALEAFSRRLSPEDEGGLWAEAVLACIDAKALPEGLKVPSTYARLADILHEPRFLVDASVLSLEEGDFLAARGRISEALSRGAKVPPELLWDSGLYGVLASADDDRVGASELRLRADASWRNGDAGRAKERWLAAIRVDPRGSWRSYASLAALSGERLAGQRDGSEFAFLEAGSKGAGRMARKAPPPSALSGAKASAYYADMIRLFPSDAGARTSYAAALLRAGRTDEAAGYLEMSAGERASERTDLMLERLSVGSRIWPESRLLAECIELINERAEDSEALSAALSYLLDRGDYSDFLVLQGRASRDGWASPRGKLFECYAALLQGHDDEAAAFLGAIGTVGGQTGADGVCAHFAMALIAEGKQDVAVARVELGSALATAGLPAQRCAIYKELGRISASEGNGDAAREAYAKASAADPSDAEAARLSHD
jgi:tetratricopeptide (TPR) repeat protein